MDARQLTGRIDAHIFLVIGSFSYDKPVVEVFLEKPYKTLVLISSLQVTLYSMMILLIRMLKYFEGLDISLKHLRKYRSVGGQVINLNTLDTLLKGAENRRVSA